MDPLRVLLAAECLSALLLGAAECSSLLSAPGRSSLLKQSLTSDTKQLGVPPSVERMLTLAARHEHTKFYLRKNMVLKISPLRLMFGPVNAAGVVNKSKSMVTKMPMKLADIEVSRFTPLRMTIVGQRMDATSPCQRDAIGLIIREMLQVTEEQDEEMQRGGGEAVRWKEYQKVVAERRLRQLRRQERTDRTQPNNGLQKGIKQLTEDLSNSDSGEDYFSEDGHSEETISDPDEPYWVEEYPDSEGEDEEEMLTKGHHESALQKKDMVNKVAFIAPKSWNFAHKDVAFPVTRLVDGQEKKKRQIKAVADEKEQRRRREIRQHERMRKRRDFGIAPPSTGEDEKEVDAWWNGIELDIAPDSLSMPSDSELADLPFETDEDEDSELELELAHEMKRAKTEEERARRKAEAMEGTAKFKAQQARDKVKTLQQRNEDS
ncbi:hypothetical protein CYMTET_23853 [Cymbomonas tetramitiformis]|uniref:Uncharacterized protein n=1 Tax=Cymbomonas tetramitiformis TaxID=36881 RepID=A0AAE0L0H9_9CHLO|nr:hypothetical protein CYMTET_23853 [Cymbomonas tetramitiformis]